MPDHVPKVSVCLPIRNGARYLGAAIESVQAQTEQDFELLISDDSSTDGSVKLVEAFAQADSRITLTRHSEPHGVFGNYNSCIQQARGKYIKLFGQDDLLDPNCLSTQIALLEQHPDVQLVSSVRRYINELGRQFPVPAEILALEPGSKYSRDDLIKACLFPISNQVGEPVCLMFRSRPQILFDESFHQLGDLEFALRLANHGRAILTDEPVVSFRVHGESCSSKNTRSIAFVADVLRLAELYKTEVATNGYSHREYLDHCIHWMANHISVLFDSDCLAFGDLTSNSSQNSDDADVFRLAAFVALKNLGAINRFERRPVQYMKAQTVLINHRERELRRLMRSRSWRFTKPLRDIKRAYWGAARSSGFDSVAEVVAPSCEEAQRQYLAYLRKQIVKLKRSVSWQITKSWRASS